MKKLKDNVCICRHFFKKVINLYFCRDKNYLNGEIIAFPIKNYYIQLIFEYFPSVKEFFQINLQPNRLLLCFFGIKLGIGVHKVISINKDQYVDDDYIQFHIDSGTVKIEEDEVQHENDESSENHKIDRMAELNLFNIYVITIGFKKSSLDEREWLGCHIDVNFRKNLPNILLKLCIIGYELTFSANKKS